MGTPQASKKRLVLVVDDVPGVLDSIERTLMRGGFDVLAAQEAGTALELFQMHGRDVSVAVLDLVLEDSVGSELFFELRRRRPELPVLFSTGALDDLGVESLLREKRTAFIPKPYAPADLIVAVEDLLRARAELSPSETQRRP